MRYENHFPQKRTQDGLSYPGHARIEQCPGEDADAAARDEQTAVGHAELAEDGEADNAESIGLLERKKDLMKLENHRKEQININSSLPGSVYKGLASWVENRLTCYP